ncbi:SDR family NAD(P)-dependent oxidoreductase [Antrihabitans sp. YC2-6]|uniref:SDR family NAD(P)-dependent oxidoreductase n=1 Tax=Antrihabitans sp. YC2-6 TaxID=2799498 RepID=UPI0018F45235|nr:SDR family NAD(P)-dependent oxidoreductase [Antrihabitans sp. YC2-6]MBJ8344914.1 SDR family NAD(P)-dependent oxidoreductase [Antrihabitans sp. YC2-6]
MPKTVVITGANAGIGLATAHDVAARGAKVVMACRNLDKAKAAREEILQRTPSADLEIISLDLSSLDHVRRFAAELAENNPQIDALINNAGASPVGQQFTEDGFEMQFGANYLGPFLLTHLLLPNLKAAESGDARIVHLSSIVHNIGGIDPDTFRGRKFYFTLTAYAQSKLANAMFNYALARRLPEGIATNAMHPGGVDSEIYRDLPKPIYSVFRLALISADKPAKLSADLALAPEHRGRTGDFLTAQRPLPVSRTARNLKKQEDLYLRSCTFVGIDPIPPSDRKN